MPITETMFWSEVERLDGIKTLDCPDSWLLMELDESLSNEAAQELTEDQRWHIGMGCARCHRIMMLARMTVSDGLMDRPDTGVKPEKTVFEMRPRTWLGTGNSLPLAASVDLKEMFPIDFTLDGGNIKIRIGESDEPGRYQVDVWSSHSWTCDISIADGVEPGPQQIFWAQVQLHAGQRTILWLSEQNLRLYMSFKRADIKLIETQGSDVAE